MGSQSKSLFEKSEYVVFSRECVIGDNRGWTERFELPPNPPGFEKKRTKFKERTYDQLDDQARWLVDSLIDHQARKRYNVKGAGLCMGADWNDEQIILCSNDSKSPNHSYCRIHSPLYSKDE